MHELIASPYLGSYLVVRPGHRNGINIPRTKYRELADTRSAAKTPNWLRQAAERTWNLDLAGRPIAETVLVRPETPYGFGRASYELNLGCNYACKHCYLGLKEFSGLDWPERERMLHAMRDAGVLWLQLTGGEPMIDRYFPAVYSLAHELGMLVEILTNGSRLANPLLLDLLTARRPYRITLSVYGATEASYDGLTQRRGSYKKFIRGLDAAHAAGLPLDLSIIVTQDNAHEVDAMHALADRYGTPAREFSNISPTIYGGAESLTSQSPKHLSKRTPFTGCDAGHAFFHVDPHGMASICKVGRDPQISLPEQGVTGLAALRPIADGLLRRQAGCSGCTLSSTCGTCMPLVTLFRKAKAPLATYCQHTEKETR
ncbi:radical SAM protein [Actinomadura fibrosa]|uniref:Radical SAM protein n=1 Tax=Actinomadura fibrosa TaxID=111802 RepID=A0ABW2XJY5_9ACTN|nr:radical SAM protein [Actinomadura fibrosa]